MQKNNVDHKIHITLIFIIISWNFASSDDNLDFGQYMHRLSNVGQIRFRENPDTGTLPILREYDFIVIGSGPGGASVANRLSEIPGWNILVLEAGKDASLYLEDPALVSFFQFTDFNWGYRMEKEEGMCLGMKDQRCTRPRGKGLGGSSLINYMVYRRGHPKDYDRYEEKGNEGWGYKDLLYYFKKSEKINNPEYLNSLHHSSKGYLDIERVPFRSKVVDVFINACKELGLNEIDYNSGEEVEGVSRIQATMRSGHRVSSAKAYLESGKNRTNLHIAIQSRVTKILIDSKTKRAIGVEFVKNRSRRVVLAKKEVILSAGALNSPQLLMLSGVGPKEHLESLGIPVIKDLPVGDNLQDHLSMPGMVFTVNTSEPLKERKALNIENILLWLRRGEGVFTLPGGVEGISYVVSNYNDRDVPDLEMLFVSGSMVSNEGRTVSNGFGITDEFYNSVYRSIEDKDTMTVFPILLRPRSRGKVRLHDRNPWHFPIFKLNYFNVTSDLDVFVYGMKRIFELAKNKSFKTVKGTFHSVPFPGCDD